VIPTLSARLGRQARRQLRRQQGLSPLRVPLASPLAGAAAVIEDPGTVVQETDATPMDPLRGPGARPSQELVQLLLWMVVVVIEGVLAMGRLVRSRPNPGDTTGPLAPPVNDGGLGTEAPFTLTDGGSRRIALA
jgi:hypothetical protein